MRTFFVLIIVLNIGSAALAQGSGGPPVDVAKIAQKLHQLDTKGSGIIDQETADKGAGVYIELRVFGPAGVTPHYPISIDELLKIASGGKGGAAPATPAGGTPATGIQASSGGTAAAAASPKPAVAGTPLAGTAAPAGAPAPPAAAGSLPPGTTPAAPSVAIKPPRRSYKLPSVKERLQSKGLPDWFLKKMDASGQILMANFTDKWTEDQVKEFEKYDLNHDGIITADEVLKVEGHRGGK